MVNIYLDLQIIQLNKRVKKNLFKDKKNNLLFSDCYDFYKKS